MVTKTVIADPSGGLYDLLRFEPDEVPFDIGSLERDALSHLGEWQKIEKRDAPYGFLYRFGMKKNVLDAEGDPATVFLHFAIPYVHRGHVLTPDIQASLDHDLNALITQSTILFSTIVDNAIGIRAQPPAYMLREIAHLLPS